MSSYLVAYRLRIQGRAQPKNCACVVAAATPKEAREKIVQKPRPRAARVTIHSVSLVG